MRRLTFVILFFALISFALFDYADAFATRNFGSTKIVSSSIPGITCAGYGPVTIVPNGAWPATNYFFPIGIPGSVNSPTSGKQILGKYAATPSPGCFTDVGTPYPVIPVLFYGASKTPKFK